MSTGEDKVRKILQRSMEEPPTGFSERVMLQIREMQKTPQNQAVERNLKSLAFAFALVSVIALAMSLLAESDFLYIQEQIFSLLSIHQMMNSILSLLGFWIWILLSPWIKKRMYMIS